MEYLCKRFYASGYHRKAWEMAKGTESGKKTGFKCLYLPGLVLVVLVICFLYVNYYEQSILTEHKMVKEDKTGCEDAKNVREEKGRIVRNKSNNAGCDLFSGKWIYDDESNPLYKEGECSFMEDDFACEKYGRGDFKYQNWRWQPRDCDLPRFNGTALLEKLRDKKLVFVGDSLNRNQWKSMLCLIESSLPPSSSKSLIKRESFFFFHANDYNATIGFYWSPFLVESNNDNPMIHRLENRVIRIQAIEKHARLWNDADILVFNSFMWWVKPEVTLLWGSFDSSDAVYRTVEMKPRLYEMALNTWSQWLETNINRTKTKLFFMSLSPYHETDENFDKEKNCYAESEPIFDEGYWGISTNRRMMEIAEAEIQKLEMRGLKVEYMNITQMSEYRKDAHPSIYREFYRNISEEQLKNPRSYSDCVHWCLPGVPDAWNQIVYAYLINS